MVFVLVAHPVRARFVTKSITIAFCRTLGRSWRACGPRAQTSSQIRPSPLVAWSPAACASALATAAIKFLPLFQFLKLIRLCGPQQYNQCNKNQHETFVFLLIIFFENLENVKNMCILMFLVCFGLYIDV